MPTKCLLCMVVSSCVAEAAPLFRRFFFFFFWSTLDSQLSPNVANNEESLSPIVVSCRIKKSLSLHYSTLKWHQMPGNACKLASIFEFFPVEDNEEPMSPIVASSWFVAESKSLSL